VASRGLAALLGLASVMAGPRLAGAQGAPDASVAQARLPRRLECGDTFRASVTMLNTGGTPWTSADALAAVGGADPFSEEATVALPAGTEVAPGESHAFLFTLTAPEIALASARTAWRMVGGDGKAYGETAAQAVVVACSPRVDDAELVAADLPARLACGEGYAARIKLRNTGGTRWSSRDGYVLGAVEGTDDFKAPARVALADGAAVPPDGDHAFAAALTAPAVAGTYRIEWRMRRGAGEWFGPAVAQSVKVVCTP
jgi:hypothetical protein